ncbi:MAG: hypothetical protein Q9223_000867 [Gallowayella weberi]
MADTPSPEDSEKRPKSYQNCVKVLPFPSLPDVRKAAPPRGRYEIPSRLYEAMRAYLDPDVRTPIQHRNPFFSPQLINAVALEKRIEQLEAYVDRFPQELDGSPWMDRDIVIGDEGQIRQDDGDGMDETPSEVHSTESDFVFSSFEKDRESVAVNEAEGMENNTSRKMPQRSGRVRAGDALLAVVVENDSDISSYLQAIPREEKARAAPSRKQGQRLESSQQPSQNTQFNSQPRDRERSFNVWSPLRWPTIMMALSPSYHRRRVMTSRRALKIVGEKCRMKGLPPDVYTNFFANFFTPSSIGCLADTCQTYNKAKPWSRTIGRPAASNVINPETRWAPPIIMDLLEAYVDAKSDENTRRGPVITKALSFQKQALFSQILDRIYSHLDGRTGVIWDTLKEFTAGPRFNRQSRMEEIHQVIIERAAGMDRDEMAQGVWTKARRQLARMIALGRNMNKLSTLCTPAVFLVVAMTKGFKMHA